MSEPQAIRQPHCETCGVALAEVLCARCGQWWRDNCPDITQRDVRITELEAQLAEARKQLQISKSLANNHFRNAKRLAGKFVEAQTNTAALIERGKQAGIEEAVAWVSKVGYKTLVIICAPYSHRSATPRPTAMGMMGHERHD